MILGAGKKPFLEFLRNLTSQILLLSIAIAMATGLDLNKFDPSNTKATIPFLLVISLSFCAAIANMLTFLEESCKSLGWLDKASKILRANRIYGWRHIRVLLILLFKRSRIIFVELLIAAIVVQVGLLVVFVASIQGAANIYSTFKQIK